MKRLEPRDANRALAVQHAALGPPEDILGVLVRFSVADIAAAERAEPESLHHLPRGQVAPACRDIAFIPALIVNDRLAILACGIARRRSCPASGDWRA